MAEQTVKMRYRGRDGDVNPDIAPYNGGSALLEDNKVYEVSEGLAGRLLISYGWKPSGEAAKEWAEKQQAAGKDEFSEILASADPTPEQHVAQSMREAREKAERDAQMADLKADAEEEARREAEVEAKREAEEQIKRDAEAKARAEAEVERQRSGPADPDAAGKGA